MEIGDTPITSAEGILQRAKVHLLASRRMRLEKSDWHLSLCSPFWRLYVNDRKGAYLKFSGRQLELLPEQCYLVPAWMPFETGLRQPLNQDFIHFTWTGFSSAILRAVFPVPVALGRDEAMEQLIGRWRNLLGEGRPMDLVDIASNYALVYAAIARALSQIAKDKRDACLGWLSRPVGVQSVLECIEGRLASPPTVSEMAAASHTSVSHFIRNFRQMVGLTPSQYCLERRIATAAQWLIESSRTIDQIAESVGFTDRFHFSKAFKARLGIPPASYRKLHFLKRTR